MNNDTIHLKCHTFSTAKLHKNVGIRHEEHLLDLKLLLVGDHTDAACAWCRLDHETEFVMILLSHKNDVGCLGHGSNGFNRPCISTFELFKIVFLLLLLILLVVIINFLVVLLDVSVYNLLAKIVLGHRDFLSQITIEIVCVFSKADCSI